MSLGPKVLVFLLLASLWANFQLTTANYIEHFGMFTVAYFPPLWFALMDARLVAAAHSDPSRINFVASRRAALMRRHGLVGELAPPR